ncbi:restriction endonuclease subunit S, partial [Methanosphaera sp.]|uniref:restriction endonuclease subunit S n=1 Tax=Methanosphaera sp. TaxID=2666342 RepID=UPI0025F31FE3
MKEQSVSNQSMKDSGIEWIGKIPIDWNIKKLKRCIIEINEKNNPVKMTNVLSLTKDKGVIPYENKGNQGNKSKEDLTQYKIAYKDTIIANSMNVIIGSVGISNYNGCVSPAYYVFKSNEENDLRFINYIFQTESFQKQLRRYANGILEIRLRISFENLLSQQIPTPSLNEQRKIAD